MTDLTDDFLIEAVMARPDLVQRIMAAAGPSPTKPKRASKPKGPILGDTAKQRAAFGRLTPERQEYLLTWEEWRRAWKRWHYSGAAHPGPEPVDTTSPEALAQSARAAELDRMTTEAEARLIARWGGDVAYAMARRDEANRNAPYRSRFYSDQDHAEAVRKYLDEASAKARAAAQQRAEV